MFCSGSRSSGEAALYPYIHICNLRNPLTLMLCVESDCTKLLSIWLASLLYVGSSQLWYAFISVLATEFNDGPSLWLSENQN